MCKINKSESEANEQRVQGYCLKFAQEEWNHNCWIIDPMHYQTDLCADLEDFVVLKKSIVILD